MKIVYTTITFFISALLVADNQLALLVNTLKDLEKLSPPASLYNAQAPLMQWGENSCWHTAPINFALTLTPIAHTLLYETEQKPFVWDSYREAISAIQLFFNEYVTQPDKLITSIQNYLLTDDTNFTFIHPETIQVKGYRLEGKLTATPVDIIRSMFKNGLQKPIDAKNIIEISPLNRDVFYGSLRAAFAWHYAGEGIYYSVFTPNKFAESAIQLLSGKAFGCVTFGRLFEMFSGIMESIGNIKRLNNEEETLRGIFENKSIKAYIYKNVPLYLVKLNPAQYHPYEFIRGLASIFNHKIFYVAIDIDASRYVFREPFGKKMLDATTSIEFLSGVYQEPGHFYNVRWIPETNKVFYADTVKGYRDLAALPSDSLQIGLFRVTRS